MNDEAPRKIELTETEENSGIFTAKLKPDYPEGSRIKVSYGYFGFEKEVEFKIKGYQ